jgi:Conserved TM helix
MDFSINSILEPLRSVGGDLLSFLPKIIASMAIIIVGLIISWTLKKLTMLICKWMKLDEKLSDIWIFRLWAQDHNKHLPSRALSNFIYYFFLFISVLLAVKILGGETSEKILNSLFKIIPGVFSFMLILFLGSLLAMFLSFIAQIMFVTSNFKHPSFWGKVVAWSTFGIAAVFSLEQLGIAGKLLSFIFVLVMSILGASIALAFGLGCKELAREFLIEILKKNKTGKND